MTVRSTGWWCLVCGERAQRSGSAVSDQYATGVCLRGADAKPPQPGCKSPVPITPVEAIGAAVKDARTRKLALARHAWHVRTKQANPMCAKCAAAATRTAAVGQGREP